MQRRDDASIAVAKHATDMGNVREALNNAQSQAFRVSRANVELTSELLRVVDQVKQRKQTTSSDPKTRRRLGEAERDLKTSRHRWKVVKGLVSGVVVGSGVNWAKDQELMDMVLEPPENEEP